MVRVHASFAHRAPKSHQVILFRAGFTSSHESWQQGQIVNDLRFALFSIGLVAAALLVSGCQNIIGGTPPTTAGFEPAVDLRQQEIDDRKDEIIRQLAHCESGGWGPSDRPIYGGRGAYLGRLQFTIQTTIAYQRKRDGTQLSRKDAIELAHDYERASSLAKYMIFDLEEPWHWPVCARKISLRNQMAAIKELSNQASAW
jgi:hypothetical protein